MFRSAMSFPVFFFFFSSRRRHTRWNCDWIRRVLFRSNNAAAGTLQFPLAAPAGKDSGALKKAPAGAVNTAPVDPSTWKYGARDQVPGGAKIWNPVRQIGRASCRERV